MFERFTERARQVVVLAQEEARGLGHDYLGTEHILLGLLRVEDGVAADALRSLGVDLEEIRAAVRKAVGAGREQAAVGQIPFTPGAQSTLEGSLQESRALGHDYIGTEHVLLGLLRENSGIAVRVLLEAGADADEVRNEVIRQLSAAAPAASAPARLHVPDAPTGGFPLAAVALGWLAFGVALGIGLLLGRFIWG